MRRWFDGLGLSAFSASLLVAATAEPLGQVPDDEMMIPVDMRGVGEVLWAVEGSVMGPDISSM